MGRTINHKVKCSICGQVFFMKLGVQYNEIFEQIMNEQGWYRNKDKEWICPECEE